MHIGRWIWTRAPRPSPNPKFFWTHAGNRPESQIILKLSIGSMAALQATGCCRTTASERRQLQLQLHSCHPFGVGTLLGEILGESLGDEPIRQSVGDPMGVPSDVYQIKEMSKVQYT